MSGLTSDSTTTTIRICFKKKRRGFKALGGAWYRTARGFHCRHLCGEGIGCETPRLVKGGSVANSERRGLSKIAHFEAALKIHSALTLHRQTRAEIRTNKLPEVCS
jgi:hypothetical protein